MRVKIFICLLLLAACLTGIDQLHKWYMLYVVEIMHRPAINVTPFFNLVMVWNPGISFGMFRNYEYAPQFFAGFAIFVSLILVIWMWLSVDRFEQTALAFIIGGAIGNVIDRLYYGAVADFFDVHIMGYHWPAFNLADSWVFIGACLMIWHALVRVPRLAREEENAEKKMRNRDA